MGMARGDSYHLTEIGRICQGRIMKPTNKEDIKNLTEDLGDFPKDSDGSAKVALIGIDRSIGAWGKILTVFPDQEKETVNIIAGLKHLRDIAEKEFPEARSFIRPGFDEVADGS